MPEIPPSLLDRYLRSDATRHAGLGEITRDYVDKMLLAALQEAQSVVRSYDTKAQIVGVGYILALNLVLHFGDLLPTRAPLGPLFFAVVWGIVIMPILQFGQVLYPSAQRRSSSRKCCVVLNSASTMSIPTDLPISKTSFSRLLGATGPRRSPPNCSRHLASGSSNRRASGAV
jgi:hypothetical protein